MIGTCSLTHETAEVIMKHIKSGNVREKCNIKIQQNIRGIASLVQNITIIPSKHPFCFAVKHFMGAVKPVPHNTRAALAGLPHAFALLWGPESWNKARNTAPQLVR